MVALEIFSVNIVTDKDFRRRLKNNSTSADEALEVVKLAFMEQKALKVDNAPSSTVTLGHLSAGTEEDAFTERSEVEVKAKLFLNNFDTTSALKAVNRICESIGSNYIDSLQIAVPVSGLNSLAIAEEAKVKDDLYRRDLDNFINFLTDLEPLILTNKKVLNIGLCDIETESLKTIYDKVTCKPKSITLNLASCCVVPSDLQEFAKASNIRLLTHNDPGLILDLKDKQGDLDLIQGLENPEMEWVVRYQIMEKSRGVLKCKKYLIGIKCPS